jgi:hypothetical protein
MRTSARKNFCLSVRIEKEISQTLFGAPRARNFAPQPRSRTSALEAIVRDRRFSFRGVQLSDVDACARFFF